MPRAIAQRIKENRDVDLQPLINAIAYGLALGIGNRMLEFNKASWRKSRMVRGHDDNRVHRRRGRLRFECKRINFNPALSMLEPIRMAHNRMPALLHSLGEQADQL